MYVISGASSLSELSESANSILASIGHGNYQFGFQEIISDDFRMDSISCEFFEMYDSGDVRCSNYLCVADDSYAGTADIYSSGECYIMGTMCI